MFVAISTLCIIYLVYLYISQLIKHKELIIGYKNQVESYKKLVPDVGAIVPISHFREVVDNKTLQLNRTEAQLSVVEKELQELKSQQQSKSVRLGLISEQVVGLIPNFPFDIKEMRFLGSPIDYVAFDFDNENIYFIEIKTGKSKLNDRQKIIKRIIEKGNIKFTQIKITETGIEYNEDL